MRTFAVLLHRWFGLAVALFLFIAGLTGAIISWDHELDAWLNPQLYRVASTGTPVSPLELAARVEATDPRVQVTYLPLGVERGHALNLSVEPRIDPATRRPYELDYNQVALDPVTGAVQGKRYWGAISLSRENLLPFLYKLHYSMHIPAGFGIELGIWMMGLIGTVWVLDCFIALWLSFPSWPSWRKSFAFRLRRGGRVLNFDLHRSGGVWVWLLLLMLAITSVSMNLNAEVMRPIVSWFSTLSPSPFASRTPRPPDQSIEPGITRAQVILAARQEAIRRGFTEPAGAVFYSAQYDLYGVGFFEPGRDHGDGGLGNSWLYFDAQDGRSIGALLPGAGTAGDIFLQAQFPLHSGRILGLPGRIAISFMGVIVAMLSVTGMILWMRKRAAAPVRRPLRRVLERVSWRAVPFGIVAVGHAFVLAVLTLGWSGESPRTPPTPIEIRWIDAPPPAVPQRPVPVATIRPPHIDVPPPTALAIAQQMDAPTSITLALASASRAPSAVLAITQPRFDADYLSNPAPVYPAVSRRLREEGLVLLRVRVSADGLASQVLIERTSGSARLDQAAVNAVEHWRFVPARRGRESIEAWVIVPIEFELKA